MRARASLWMPRRAACRSSQGAGYSAPAIGADMARAARKKRAPNVSSLYRRITINGAAGRANRLLQRHRFRHRAAAHGLQAAIGQSSLPKPPRVAWTASPDLQFWKDGQGDGSQISSASCTLLAIACRLVGRIGRRLRACLLRHRRAGIYVEHLENIAPRLSLELAEAEYWRHDFPRLDALMRKYVQPLYAFRERTSKATKSQL